MGGGRGKLAGTTTFSKLHMLKAGICQRGRFDSLKTLGPFLKVFGVWEIGHEFIKMSLL